MESEGINLLINSTVVIAVFAGACMLLLMYIIKVLNTDQKSLDHKPKHDKLLEQAEKKKESGTSGKPKKKISDNRWAGRSDKQGFTHPWLLTSLKGHTNQVLDMDYSSNGKYLASCGEEDPGGDLADNSSNCSNSDCNQDSSLPSSSNPSPRVKGLSRRQRKNRRREDPSPPECKKKQKPKRAETSISARKASIITTTLKHYLKLNLADRDLAVFLRSYVLTPEQMLAMGYPVEIKDYPHTYIFKSAVPTYNQNNYRCTKINVSESRFDVNAQEFVPGMDYSEIRDWNANYDSGQGSGSSSDSGELYDDYEPKPRYTGKTSNTTQPAQYYSFVQVTGYQPTNNCTYVRAVNVVPNLYSVNEERDCVRCGKGFFITNTNTYLTHETCLYHWGKLQNTLAPSAGKHNKSYEFLSEYTCCQGDAESRGCTTAKSHVWNGTVSGYNGPYDYYMHTRQRKTPPYDGNYGVYALDCEMCYTVAGLELTKVTVIGTDGRLVYDSFVKPENEVIDYNTKFSGISAKDLSRKGVKTLREVQNDLMGFINADTILIGHGLENDLRALRIRHGNVVDTALAFPHYNGLPFRRSLKSLTTCFLRREIQCDVNGHNSYEDACACMELMLWRIRKDFRTILEHNLP